MLFSICQNEGAGLANTKDDTGHQTEESKSVTRGSSAADQSKVSISECNIVKYIKCNVYSVMRTDYNMDE